MVCPLYLAEKLAAIWETNDVNSPYFVISEVVGSLEMDERKGSAKVASRYTGKSSVLCDTLYRYLVMFGLPEDVSLGSDDVWFSSPVWAAITDALSAATTGLDDDVSGRRARTRTRRNAGRDDCMERFEKDSGVWSVTVGTHDLMQRCVCPRLCYYANISEFR